MKSANTNSKNNRRVIGGILIILLGVLSVSIPQFVAAQPTIFATPTTYIDPGILQLQQQLEKTSINDSYRHNLETKISVLSRDATKEALGEEFLKTNRPTRQILATSTGLPDSDRLTGIIDDPTVPFSPQEYRIENAWQEKVGDKYVLVFAGAETSDPQQGVLIVVTENPLSFRYYKTPSKLGSVKITDFRSFQLVIQTKDKHDFYFDIPGLAFIPTLGAIIPTITPGIQETFATPVVGSDTPIPAYP